MALLQTFYNLVPHPVNLPQVNLEKVTKKICFGYYENVTQTGTLPVGTGGQNGLTHELTKNGNADRKEKEPIPDRYVRLTGYDWKYVILVLSMPFAKTAAMAGDGKAVTTPAEKNKALRRKAVPKARCVFGPEGADNTVAKASTGPRRGGCPEDAAGGCRQGGDFPPHSMRLSG
ncbi:MAG: hypothetical protein LBP37_06940 [Spirochaetaceae bacterium]|jgi:hypothetical protein|nr:hypothetical protein [Spirochaetaceae bacterium]